jgi:hypothetical protein
MRFAFAARPLGPGGEFEPKPEIDDISTLPLVLPAVSNETNMLSTDCCDREHPNQAD